MPDWRPSEIVFLPDREAEIVSSFMDKGSKGGPDFLSTFVDSDEGHCVWNHDRPALAMEVFRVDADQLVSVSEFSASAES